MPLDDTSPALDLLLLGTVLALELSDRDRRVLQKRYDLLKPHLERRGSPLAPYLNDRSLVYAQGSRAIGATIVYGNEDDRFDLDGILEFPTPPGWGPEMILDQLYQGLEGFPDAVGIKRCTRCIQIQFAFMHLDVTPMDPAAEPRIERVGEIYHCPDRGLDERIPANPYGFAQWFRRTVVRPELLLQREVAVIRASMGLRDRIALGSTLKADIDVDDLPDEVDPIRDAPQVIALKLMKRYLFLRYAKRDERRPPSVYLSKLAAMTPVSRYGICAQLEDYAELLAGKMVGALEGGKWPEERNPTLLVENFNDRWPTAISEMRLFLSDLQHLRKELATARASSVEEIQRIFSGLFGETVTETSLKAYLGRLSDRPGKSSFERGKGFVAAPAILPSTSGAKASVAPAHRFHSGLLKKR